MFGDHDTMLSRVVFRNGEYPNEVCVWGNGVPEYSKRVKPSVVGAPGIIKPIVFFLVD